MAVVNQNSSADRRWRRRYERGRQRREAEQDRLDAVADCIVASMDDARQSYYDQFVDSEERRRIAEDTLRRMMRNMGSGIDQTIVADHISRAVYNEIYNAILKSIDVDDVSVGDQVYSALSLQPRDDVELDIGDTGPIDALLESFNGG